MIVIYEKWTWNKILAPSNYNDHSIDLCVNQAITIKSKDCNKLVLS